MAGSWEAFAYRVRDGGAEDYDMKVAAYRREQSEETVKRLKELGFNLVIIPFYKGAGLETERAGMEDARRFAAICHKHGLRVGGYIFSGTVLYESALAENPAARDWFIRDYNGNYTYYSHRYYRRWINRSHPGVRTFMRELVRFAVQEAKIDYLHFDNYMFGPGYEPYSIEQFRTFLKRRYSASELIRRLGFSNVDFIEPPPPPPQLDRYNTDPLYQDWIDYRCETQADTYRELAELARSLNPEILVECNPHGYYGQINGGTVDHARLIQWGGGFWDEGDFSRLENGIVHSRFRSHKFGRQFGNMVAQYTRSRVALAESLANNLQCAGMALWFGGGVIVPSDTTAAYLRFFRREQHYWRETEEIADVGVLNTFANQSYGPSRTRDIIAAVEQALYQGKVPFTLVPERYPGKLGRFRVLVLADLALISDRLLGAVREFVHAGGGLVMTGQAARFDENYHRRTSPGLAELFSEPLADKVLQSRAAKGRAVYIPRVVIPERFQIGMLPENRKEVLDAVRWAAGEPLQIEIQAPETVTMSLYEQPRGRRLLHLVNYDEKQPAENIEVHIQLSSDKRASVTLLSPDSPGSQRILAEQNGQRLRFRVPRLEVYSLLVIE